MNGIEYFFYHQGFQVEVEVVFHDHVTQHLSFVSLHMTPMLSNLIDQGGIPIILRYICINSACEHEEERNKTER
jgi:hypothetical protein